MSALQRSVSQRGAKFFRQGGKLMFVLNLDGSTRFGPREASIDDLDAFPSAFAAFEAEDDGGAIGPLPARGSTPPSPTLPSARGKGGSK